MAKTATLKQMNAGKMSKDLPTNNLRAIRNMAGLTQEQVGNELGMTAQAIGAIERGENGLSHRQIEKLCALFACTADELLGLRPITPSITEAMNIMGTLDTDTQKQAVALLKSYIENIHTPPQKPEKKAVIYDTMQEEINRLQRMLEQITKAEE